MLTFLLVSLLRCRQLEFMPVMKSLENFVPVGIKFYVLSNRTQKQLDVLNDPDFLKNVREFFGLDEDAVFVWESLS